MDMSNPFRSAIFNIIPPLQRGFDRAFGHAARAARSACRHLPLRSAFLCIMIAAAAWTPDANAGPSSLDGAAEAYRRCLIEDLGRALADARLLRERIGARDLDGARQAWIEARIGWERSEVFTSGFVPDLDREIDAWPNARHGFHGIEAMLFGANRTDFTPTDVREETDALVAHLADLHTQVHDIPLSPQRLLNGVARLAFEIGGSKADGGESRLSGTSLNDMQSNADGIASAYRVVFSEAVGTATPRLAQAAQAAIERLKALVEVSALRNLDVEKLRVGSEELIAILQNAAPGLGLDKPTLEDSAVTWRDGDTVVAPVPRD
jgi:iron uptake system EfeUOB component EfeO/EfeM